MRDVTWPRPFHHLPPRPPPPPTRQSGSRSRSSSGGAQFASHQPSTAVMAAPLAQFDEDWQDFNEFKPFSEERLDQLNSNVADAAQGLDDLSELDRSFSGDICSFRSMEDLVHDFDEKLTVCFRNYNTTTEDIAPVQPITEDSYLKDDE